MKLPSSDLAVFSERAFPGRRRQPGGFISKLGWLAAGLVVVALVSAGCRGPASGSWPAAGTAMEPVAPGTANYATNLLAEGDLLSITFEYSTNFNTVQKITLDGMLNLESVPPVKAAGKTLAELQSELRQAYKPQVKDDVVTVKLVTAATSVYVSGAVNHPGKIPMDRPLTALEAIMEAGGFEADRAKPSGVTVLRVEDGRQQSFRVDLGRVLAGKEDKPFYLRPFDIVHVPLKKFNL